MFCLDYRSSYSQILRFVSICMDSLLYISNRVLFDVATFFYLLQ